MDSGGIEFRTPEDVAERLKTFRFRQRLFGGVDEKNVWEGIGKLDSYYRQVFDDQEDRTEAIIRERDEKIRRLLLKNQKLRAGTEQSREAD